MYVANAISIIFILILRYIYIFAYFIIYYYEYLNSNWLYHSNYYIFLFNS